MLGKSTLKRLLHHMAVTFTVCITVFTEHQWMDQWWVCATHLLSYCTHATSTPSQQLVFWISHSPRKSFLKNKRNVLFHGWHFSWLALWTWSLIVTQKSSCYMGLTDGSWETLQTLWPLPGRLKPHNRIHVATWISV